MKTEAAKLEPWNNPLEERWSRTSFSDGHTNHQNQIYRFLIIERLCSRASPSETNKCWKLSMTTIRSIYSNHSRVQLNLYTDWSQVFLWSSCIEQAKLICSFIRSFIFHWSRCWNKENVQWIPWSVTKIRWEYRVDYWFRWSISHR